MSRKRNRRSKRPIRRGEHRRRLAARGGVLSPGARQLYDLLRADPQLAEQLGVRVTGGPL